MDNVLEQAKVGQRVKLHLFNRDAKIVTGKVVSVGPDPDRGLKPAKYKIQLDKPDGSGYHGEVSRYHPHGVHGCQRSSTHIEDIIEVVS